MAALEPAIGNFGLEHSLIALVETRTLIVTINRWNRLAVGFRAVHPAA